MAKTFTIMRITAATSHTGFETVSWTEWSDSFMSMPLNRGELIYSQRGWYCECTGDYTSDRPTRNPACVHVAVYRTWRRQGRPGWDLWLDKWPAVAMYQVDNGGHLWRNNCGKLTKLSLVEQVNLAPLYPSRRVGP